MIQFQMVNTMKLEEGWVHVFFVPLAAEDLKCECFARI